MKRKVSTLIAAGILVFSILSLTAAEGQGRGGFGRGRRADPENQLTRLKEELDLSEEQVEQVRIILQKNREKMRETMEKFREEGRSPSTMRAMREQMQKMEKETDLSLSRVFSQDQMDRYRELQERRRERGRPRGRERL